MDVRLKLILVPVMSWIETFSHKPFHHCSLWSFITLFLIIGKVLIHVHTNLPYLLDSQNSISSIWINKKNPLTHSFFLITLNFMDTLYRKILKK